MKKKIMLGALVLAMAVGFCGCNAPVTEPTRETESSPSVIPNKDFDYESNTDGSITLTSYKGTDVKLQIPRMINGSPVTAIDNGCFAGNVHLKKVSIPEGITSVGEYAFECCSALQKVYFPETLVSIGNGAFSGCASLYLIDIQENTQKIGDGAFMSCNSLVSFIAPKNLTEIGKFAFAGCKSLLMADFSKSNVTVIPDRMLYDCKDLIDVRLSEKTQEVGKRAFENCTALPYIYLPESITDIKSYAFSGCELFESVQIPCKTVEPYTFSDCSMLSSVFFSESLERISSYAFFNTSITAESLSIPAGAVVDEKAFGHFEDEELIDGNIVNTDEITEERSGNIDVKVLKKEAENKGYRVILNDDFKSWSKEYLAFNEGNILPSMELNPYISMYKAGGDERYYMPMTAVASKDPASIAEAKKTFGDDFEEMYTMINHGLTTEINRFKINDDLLLFTGVYDSQLMAAAGLDRVPTLDELKSRIGETFTDMSLTSTTTDEEVAFDFGDTVFVIFAPAESLNAVGNACMDSYMRTSENEILINSGATYQILDVGTVEKTILNYEGKEEKVVRNFVKLQLISE